MNLTPRWSRHAAILLLVLLLGATRAAPAAGFQAVSVPAAAGEPQIRAMVWTPCANKPGPVELGPYLIQGTRNCAVAGQSLPLVVISHGQGGSALGHHDTATALSDAGFVVVSFNHPGDSFDDDGDAQELRIFESRPRDVSRVISFMLTAWPQRNQLNSSAIGVFGFSRGGYTALALAGATPSVKASAERFCGPWWSFVITLCRRLGSDDARVAPRADPRVRAVVVVDPLDLFDAAGMRTVRVPVQLWASELGGDGVALEHVQAIRNALTPAPEFRIAMRAGHFAYLAPCSPQMRDAAPKLCDDPAGFDRVRWHQVLNSAVIDFFGRQLRPVIGSPLAAEGRKF